MKNPLLVALLALVLSIVALGAMFLQRSKPRSESGPVLPDSISPDSDLSARFEALSKQNEALRQRLALVELRPAPSATQRSAVGEAFVPLVDFELFRKEMHEALAGGLDLAGRLAPDSADFKSKVAAAMDDLQHEKAVKGALSYQEKRLARLEQTMPKIESWLDLSPYQSAAMRSALLGQYEREADMVQRWANGEDSAVMAELKATNRELNMTELATILTPEQLDTYRARGGGK